jgi:hypothetical protein
MFDVNGGNVHGNSVINGVYDGLFVPSSVPNTIGSIARRNNNVVLLIAIIVKIVDPFINV